MQSRWRGPQSMKPFEDIYAGGRRTAMAGVVLLIAGLIVSTIGNIASLD